jgi:hypothetical protein
MDPGEQTTGTRDEDYNLVSVLYHALHGAETIEAYVVDAEAAGDERLADFFREAQATHRELAERAKDMLGVLEVPPEPEVAPDAPVEGGISPGAMSGGMPPQPAGIRAEESGVPAGEMPPTTDVPRTPPGMTPLPDEELVAEPGDVLQRETLPERPPREAPPAGIAEDAEGAVAPGRASVVPPPTEGPGEPARRPEQQTAGQTEGEQKEEQQEEKKGLVDKIVDKAADKLTGR